jgi:hypothetical protein
MQNLGGQQAGRQAGRQAKGGQAAGRQAGKGRSIRTTFWSDLRILRQHVMQSKGVLTRPWVIMELYTAVTGR